MYYSPRWRGGRVASARARQVPVEAHQGTYRDYLRRHEREAAVAARADRATKQRFVASLLTRTADSRNLRAAWDYLAHNGGQAPGPDGLRFEDLADHEVWGWARAASRAILDGTYRPGPDRQVPISKGSGRGTRTISIPSILDRVVQRAITQVTQPYLDPEFLDTNLGYRPKKSAHQALALAETLMEKGKRTAWITEDVRDAFNQIPQNRLLDILRRHLPDHGMVNLLERVIQTPSRRGVRQGGCLSPLLLNIYLDHFLDRPWKRMHPDTPLLRVADDILVLCRGWTEAHEAYADLREMLRVAGMPLKGSPAKAIWDLGKGQKTAWLGYQLEIRQGQLAINLAEKAWSKLKQALEELHLETDAVLRVNAVIRGWLNYLGPCFHEQEVSKTHARVRRTATQLGFEETDSLNTFQSHWHQAYARWHRTRKAVRDTNRPTNREPDQEGKREIS